MGVSTQSTWESMFSVADHENENVTDSGTTPARRHLVWSNEQVEKGSQIVAILAASPGGSHPDALECLVINFLKGLTETVDSFFNNINNINNLLTNIPHHQLFPLLDRVIIHLSQQDVQYSTRDVVYRVALVDQRKHLADTFKPVFESDSCFERVLLMCGVCPLLVKLRTISLSKRGIVSVRVILGLSCKSLHKNLHTTAQSQHQV